MLALLIANAGVTVSEFVGIAAATELFGYPFRFGSTCRGDDLVAGCEGSIKESNELFF